MSSFLDLEGKIFFIAGINNKKSVATFIAKELVSNGAKILASVQNQEQKEYCQRSFPEAQVFICDVEKDGDIQSLKKSLGSTVIDGFVHSLAFAHFEPVRFEETSFENFSQAIKISAYSLMSLSNALRDNFSNEASVITISISNLRATSYGYMGPIKSMLNSTVDYLAKSFSEHSNVRFNSIAAGPLKTSASAGIPNYMPNYFYAEKLTLRKRNLSTQEIANTAAFLLSPKSSGINATTLTVDAGMNANFFDQSIVKSLYDNDLTN